MSNTLTVSDRHTALPSGQTEGTLVIPFFNFDEDWKIVPSSNQGEIVLKNVRYPLDEPMTIRVSISEIKDIYKGSTIDASAKIPARAGIAVFAEYRATGVMADSNDPSFRGLVPLVHSHRFVVPSAQGVDGTMILSEMARSMGMFFNASESGATADRINELVHGVLSPL